MGKSASPFRNEQHGRHPCFEKAFGGGTLRAPQNPAMFPA
jgi:hypothetical protein